MVKRKAGHSAGRICAGEEISFKEDLEIIVLFILYISSSAHLNETRRDGRVDGVTGQGRHQVVRRPAQHLAHVGAGHVGADGPEQGEEAEELPLDRPRVVVSLRLLLRRHCQVPGESCYYGSDLHNNFSPEVVSLAELAVELFGRLDHGLGPVTRARVGEGGDVQEAHPGELGDDLAGESRGLRHGDNGRVGRHGEDLVNVDKLHPVTKQC